MSAQSYCPNCDIIYPMAHECCPLCMLKQVSGVLCDKCGWAMKFPNDDTNTEEPCRCELVEENEKLRKVLQLVRRNIPDYLPEYDSGDSPSEVVKECSAEIAMGLVKINKALNELGMVYWNE